MKRYGDLLTENLLVILFGVVVAYATSYVTAEQLPSLLAGLVGIAIGYAIAILFRIERAQNNIIDSRKSYMDVLMLVRECYEDRWLKGTTESLIKLTRRVDQDRFRRRLIASVLQEALVRAERDLSNVKTFNGGDGERNRAIELADIIAEAQEYVYAVTYDTANFRVFWELIGPAYTKVNIEAARRGVQIERIFVFPDDVLNGKSTDQAVRLRQTAKQQLEANIAVTFIAKEKLLLLDPKLYSSTTGFVICDGRVFSASYFADEGGENVQGYICHGCDFEDLHTHFQSLRRMAQGVEVFKFME